MTGSVERAVNSLVATGIEAQRTGDLDAAEKAFAEALAADPNEPRAIRYLGAILTEREAVGAAVELFESALGRVGPPSPAALGFYNNYANALRRAERYEDAEKLLRELTGIAPDAWQPWHNLGQALRDTDRLEEAAAAMRRAITLEPRFGPNHGVLGEILFRLGELRGAEAELQKCLELGWLSDPNVWATIGSIQRGLGRLDKALEAFQRALSLTGATPAAHSNVGLVLAQLGRFEEAIAHLDLAVDLDPNDDRMHAYRGYVLLSAGRLPEAWDEWERGFEIDLRGKARAVGVPQWTRADINARVLVYREQGIGDELMFASCYADIIAEAREVIIECEPRLTALFARSFQGAEVRPVTVDASGNETRRDYDRAISAGSLPRVLRRTIDEFPRRPEIVKADPTRIVQWRRRLRAAGPAPYVGIAWRSRLMTAERHGEYTELTEWGALFAVPGITWVNLQYDECEGELRDAERRFGLRVHRWGSLDLMNDLDEVAALTTALDVVVSARTAVAMLSGALGVDTIMLASRYSWADLGTDRLPWLPAVQTIYREPTGDWAPALSTAASALAEIARGVRRV